MEVWGYVLLLVLCVSCSISIKQRDKGKQPTDAKRVTPSKNEHCPTSKRKLPKINLSVYSSKGSTAQNIEWTTTPTFPEDCGLKYRLRRKAKTSSEELVVQDIASNGKLITENLVPQTEYEYVIAITGRIQGKHRRINKKLSVKTPTSGMNVTIERLEWSQGSLRMEWLEMLPGNNIQFTVFNSEMRYVYLYYKGNEGTLPGLPPCKNFTLKAELRNGEEIIYSDGLMYISAWYPALQAPTDVIVETRSQPIAHRITWHPTILDQPTCSQLSYRLEQTIENSAGRHTVYLTTDKTDQRLHELLPDTIYHYRVQSVLNSVYEGTYSEAHRILTPPEPSKPMEPSVTWTDAGLLLNWTDQLNLREHIQKIHVLRNNNGKLVEFVEESNTSQLTLGSASIHCDSLILFAVENMFGLSDFITVPIPTRLPLPVPHGLKVKTAPNSLAHWVTWNSIETSCKVFYRLKILTDSQPGDSSTNILETNQTRYFISDVKPRTKYTYAVQAVNMNHDTSLFSMPAELETPGVPEMKVEVNAELTPNGLKANWIKQNKDVDNFSHIVFFLKEGNDENLVHIQFSDQETILPGKHNIRRMEVFAAVQNAVGLSSFKRVDIK